LPGGLKITAKCEATTFKFLEPGEKPPAEDKGKKPAPKPAAGEGGAT
jgi:hypothetical protein